jgi:hypothetical protein
MNLLALPDNIPMPAIVATLRIPIFATEVFGLCA